MPEPWQKDCQQFGRYLEQLGATEWSVERWGLGFYRASCRVRVLPRGTLWSRHFEATGTEASEAMAKLLEQVVGWREERSGGSYPPEMGAP
ncbi:MAG: hypothetical protein NZ602_07740 [Thermoguttaceae bacterium]|nr:hypothetical protein [Thermoguttaceae bacterium]MDW8039585.1 hypothetical protein [Thermoguttaceae bacterium]